MKLGHTYRSATEAALVGGDFYDAFPVGGGRLAVVIGDVCGHGVEAARVAALTADLIYASAAEGLAPEEALRRTDSLLRDQRLPGFVTVFLGILHVDSGHLAYASAGHPQGLIRRASGGLDSLAAGSPPLGLALSGAMSEGETDMHTGDVLVLYTDGVIEARRGPELFTEKRLHGLLRRSAPSATDLPGLILDEVLRFAAGSLRDDLAILTLSLEPNGSRGATT